MSLNSFGTQASASAIEISPSDSADLPVSIRGLYVGVTGNVKVLFADDTVPVTLTSMQAGALYAMALKRVYASGTTAASLVGLV